MVCKVDMRSDAFGRRPLDDDDTGLLHQAQIAAKGRGHCSKKTTLGLDRERHSFERCLAANATVRGAVIVGKQDVNHLLKLGQLDPQPNLASRLTQCPLDRFWRASDSAWKPMREMAGDQMEEALDMRAGIGIAAPAIIGPAADNPVQARQGVSRQL